VLEYPDWVNVVPLTKDNEIVLVRQYRHGAGDCFLEIPAGCIDPSDARPLDAAKRELAEETGYSSDNFIGLCTLFPNPANQANRLHGFLALDAEISSVQSLDENEDIEIVKLPIAEVRDTLMKSGFGQALQAAVLFYAMEYLKGIGRLK
jgi:8-oxo-dGTP pyrophosphatase MutT (NUDIX family)